MGIVSKKTYEELLKLLASLFLEVEKFCTNIASGLLKRAVAGPKWSEGLPCRGPVGRVTVALMLAKFFTQSDGELKY